MEKRLFQKHCRDTFVSNESKLAVDTWQREREKERKGEDKEWMPVAYRAQRRSF